MSRARTWFRRLLQNPLTTGVLCFLLWNDWSNWRLREPRLSQVPAQFSSSYPLWRQYWDIALAYPAIPAVAVRHSFGFRFIEREPEEAYGTSSFTPEQQCDATTLQIITRRTYEGLWCPTSVQLVSSVETRPFSQSGDSDWSLDDWKLAREQFLDWCAATSPGGWERVAHLVRRGNLINESATIWSGYLHNTLALLAAILTLYSAAWIPRSITWALASRTRRRLALGQCTRCGYDLDHIKERCPECGATVSPHPDR